jgi:predicted permease
MMMSGVEGLAPMFALIALGWAARARGIVSAEAFAAVNRFGYFVLYPAFLFMTISGATIGFSDALPFLFGALAGFAAMAAIALFLRFFSARMDRALPPSFQGSRAGTA